MPPPRRIQRLQQLILEVAATAVQRELADPRLGFVTLTHVRLAPDLMQATVFWSCLGTEAQRRTTARALLAATPVVQSIVAKALTTRVTPALTFQYDPSLAHAERLETIFEKLRRERPPAPEEAAPAGDVPAEGDDEPDDKASDKANGEPGEKA